jgi:hypothetical protein
MWCILLLIIFILESVPTTLVAAHDNKDAADAFYAMEKALAGQKKEFTPEDEYYLGRTAGASPWV